MMDTRPGLGLCSRCGQQKIQAGDKVVCFSCSENSTAPAVDVRDPGEAELAQVLAKTGVHIPGLKGTAPAPIMKPVNVPANTIPQLVIKADSLEYHVQQALSMLKAAPMPKDIKQFKQINKAISILEGLAQEK